MKKIAASLILLLLCPLLLHSQGETANWYFGQNTGIRFNNDGTVSPVTDSAIDTFEGCATISDNFGNLLFYTDGISVYDRNHNVMPNGKGLYGDPSSTQSALIVPQPDSSTIFYIFTVDTSLDVNDQDQGFNYSVVDISLNGGNGAVTTKNVQLINNTSEKLTAVIKDCFDKSIWVLTLAPEDGYSPIIDTFYAFEVTSTGVNPQAVKSKLNAQIQDARGYLKLNSTGDKIAAANVTSGLYLYDFDAATGIVSNEQQINIQDDNINPYGLEFSPNNRFLYVQTYNNVQVSVGHSSSLLQYDLTAGDIAGSMVLLDKRPIYRGALQLGPDGKIYRALARAYEEGTPYLGVIENPDEIGLNANYQHNRISLRGNNSTQGLPPFIQSFFSKRSLVQNADGTSSNSIALCEGDSVSMVAEALPNATYLWEKDGLPINVVGNTYDLNTVGPQDGGRYSVDIIPDDPSICPIYAESLIEVLEVPQASIQLTQCDLNLDNSTDGITTINLDRFNTDEDITYYFYENETDRLNDSFITSPSEYVNTVPFQQTLLYKAVNIKGCEYFGELDIDIFPVSIVPNSTGPFYSCDLSAEDENLYADFDLNEIRARYAPLDVAVYESLQSLALEQNALSGLYRSEGQSLYVRLQDGNQCQGVEIVDLIVNPLPDVNLRDQYLLCTDAPGITIAAPSGFASYSWFHNSSGREIQISDLEEVTLNETGIYRLEVVSESIFGNEVITCSNSNSFEVIASNKATIESIEIEDFSANNKVSVTVTGEGIYEYSIDGFDYQEEAVFENLEPGIYTLHIQDLNGCGITEKEISVLGYPKFFTPNGDGVNDYWQITGIQGETAADSRVFIYDRYGRVVTQILPSDIGWNGRASARDLPAADYWFSIRLNNGREFKGHFALKR
ncbi:T9SS type B sorting domain-containing protein [Flavobacteriaceae bacterium D16]|nr:T9SS type B sorting domain-containing protein [Flavobacteriaceae bacterium D16]